MLKIFGFSNHDLDARAVLLRKMVWGILAVLSTTFIAGIIAQFKFFERYLLALSCVHKYSITFFNHQTWFFWDKQLYIVE